MTATGRKVGKPDRRKTEPARTTRRRADKLREKLDPGKPGLDAATRQRREALVRLQEMSDEELEKLREAGAFGRAHATFEAKRRADVERHPHIGSSLESFLHEDLSALPDPELEPIKRESCRECGFSRLVTAADDAALRLERHVHTYKDYLDRDRDILLLRILELLERL